MKIKKSTPEKEKKVIYTYEKEKETKLKRYLLISQKLYLTVKETSVEKKIQCKKNEYKAKLI